MHAFVQIALDSAREQEVFDRLQDSPEVKEVSVLFGEWDILAKLELEDPEALGTFILNKVRPMQGVRLTSTMIVAKAGQKQENKILAQARQR